MKHYYSSATVPESHRTSIVRLIVKLYIYRKNYIIIGKYCQEYMWRIVRDLSLFIRFLYKKPLLSTFIRRHFKTICQSDNKIQVKYLYIRHFFKSGENPSPRFQNDLFTLHP